jgi:23S rRNA (cytosine1962-C5)-methyltransferase
VLRRHPWVFSGAVAHVSGAPADGDTVEIRAANEDFLAWGAYSGRSQIRARLWSWEQGTTIDASFFRRRISEALEARRVMGLEADTDALRLVHAESDGLPGLVVDRYGDTLVVQFLSWGAERWRETIVELLAELSGMARIYERSDVSVRALEGLPQRKGLLGGEPLPKRVRIREHGLSFWADLAEGHKTGFYLDQRANRQRLGACAAGREVLDCFSYTGGFSVAALAGGAASVLAVDASASALALGRANLVLNGLPTERSEFMEGDVFQVLREFRDRGRFFDLIVLDPPKFAPTAAQAGRAARGYKDINLLAFKLLRPGGLLFTFSCSGGVGQALFQKIVAGAALDAGVDAQILERLRQGADHPVALNFPEGEYLKGLLLRV